MLDALAVAHRDRWTHETELLATIAEGIDALIRVTVMANSDPKRKPRFPPPYRYPRPGRAAAKRTTVHPRDLARRMLSAGR